MLTTKVTKTLAKVQANAPSQRPSIILRGEKANLRCPYGPGVSAFFPAIIDLLANQVGGIRLSIGVQ